MTLIEQIEAAYERDQQDADRLAVEASDIPLGYENMTPEWLTAVLCSSTPGAEVVGFNLDARDDGSSNRRRITVEYNEQGRAAGLPTALFGKASHDLSNRVVLGLSGAARTEVGFYTDVRPGLEIEAPACYHARLDPESFNSIILLEDLSDSVTEFCSHETQMPIARAQSEMRTLATLHGAYWGKAETASGPLRDFQSWPEYFEAVQAFGMEEGSTEGFLAGEEVIPPRLFSRGDEIWPKTMTSVALHDQAPKTLAHGDVHLKNWYVAGTGEMGLADWQCSHRGLWARDVAYALSTALTTEHRRAWEEELLRYYLEQLQAAGGPQLGYDEALTAYRQQLITALTWWTITLRPAPGMPDMQPLDITLEFVRRISVAMDDHGTLDLL
jgi:hypothetical protein